jgi:molybdopterin synthase sulfur carrier subunit
MVLIEFLGPIEKEAIELDIGSLEELAQYMAKDDELKKWLGNSAIAVNDKIVTQKNYELKAGDKISILPPVCGG